MRYLLLIVLFFSTFAHALNNRPQITWMKWNDPPIYILDGPYRSVGLLDLIQQDMEVSLPQYDHTTKRARIVDILELAKEKKEICNAGLLDTPDWREFFYFSRPHLIIPSNGVIVKAALYDKLLPELKALNGNPSLSFFFENKKLTAAVGRRYGVDIDSYLDVNEKDNPYIKTKDNLHAFKLLFNNLADFTIGYPFEIKFYEQGLANPTKLIHIPIAETPETTSIVFACSKTPAGLKAIELINNALTRHHIQLFESYLDRWLASDDILKLHKARVLLLDTLPDEPESSPYIEEINGEATLKRDPFNITD